MKASADNLPDEALHFLLRAIPSRALWKWLSQTDNAKLLAELTRGFQRTAANLNLPVVRSRFVLRLRQQPDLAPALLCLWAEGEPAPVTTIADLDDETLIGKLPDLFRELGPEKLLLAIVHGERESALEAYATLEPADLPGRGNAIEPEPAGAKPAAAPVKAVAAAAPKPIGAVAQTKTRQAHSRNRALEDELTKLKLAHLNELKALKLRLKQEEHQRQALEKRLQETIKGAERTARRQRQAERALEEATAETKTLKRQLRQAQQLHEEQRKQFAALQTKTPTMAVPDEPTLNKSPEKKKPAIQKRVPAPPTLDRQFVWKADGKPFRISAREVGRAIDTNNEDVVFSLIQGFEALREMNLEGYKLFIEQIRALGRYYVRVLTADTTRVLVDASNVARFEKDRAGKGRLRQLLNLRSELRMRDCFPIVLYADASLAYNIDEPAELAAMARRGEIEMVEAGTEADEILAREARRTGAYVVTNDRNFYLKVTPDFEPPRISFRIVDGTLMLDEF